MKFSALTGDRVLDLQQSLVAALEPGPYYYPPDLVTDQPERFIMGELIREEILKLTRDEVPHSVAIAIEKVEELPSITRIFAVIHVERDSQKGIIIGKQGSALKKLGTDARKDLEAFFQKKIFLETHVKVAGDWRKQQKKLRQFGYLE